MLRGTIKGQQERILILAHQTAAFSRETKLKPVQHYLRQARKAQPRKGDATVLLSQAERDQLRKLTKGPTNG